MHWDIQDHAFAKAVAGIQRRAEKQSDIEKLANIYVPSDMSIRATSSDSQLIVGRRGTGKTHLMRVFEKEKLDEGERVYYFDCTRLGSGYSGLTIDPEALAKKYFVAFLNELAAHLMDGAVNDTATGGQQERTLGLIIDGLGACLAPTADSLLSTFNYRQLTDVLSKILRELGYDRLFLVLDEWAQVPVKAQPYFADYIKHAIIPVRSISIKILAVNYQCVFSEVVGGETIGLQRGADIPDIVDMDAYLVYDEDKENWMVDFFGQVLYNHLASELGASLDVTQKHKEAAILKLFTQRATFVELVRAAEGNCRDFLCIFSRAYFDGFRQAGGANAISIPHVRNAAGSWYSNEKESNIKAEAEVQSTLAFILNNVLKEYKSRTFMVAETKSDHPRLSRLLNERVIHRLRLEYSHPDKPGERYALFTIDYGAYVRWKGTVNEPSEKILIANDRVGDLLEEERALIVPYDEFRSIRRVVFDPERLLTQPTFFDA